MQVINRLYADYMISLLRANRHDVTQEIYFFSKNTKIHYHVQKRPSLHSLLSQINPFPTPYFLKIHLNNILPRCTKCRSQWSSGIRRRSAAARLLR